jgi:thiamine-phosphate pyrophosphorylase
MTLPRFYPVFPDAGWLARTLPLGVRFVQLRAKDRPEADLRAEVRRARDLCARHKAQLVVNDYWRLAIEEECDFVHLGQEDLDGADLAAIRRAGIRLGISTHDHAELDRALACRPDYVALGPIYPTILKKMKWQEQGLDRLSEWRRLVGDLPLVAIGGLTVERAPGVFAAGADVAAAVTDITLNADPEARVRDWLEVAA